MPLPRKKGYTIPQMFDAAVDGRLKAMYIFGEDVAQTDPNTAHVVHALESLEFLVCHAADARFVHLHPPTTERYLARLLTVPISATFRIVLALRACQSRHFGLEQLVDDSQTHAD